MKSTTHSYSKFALASFFNDFSSNPAGHYKALISRRAHYRHGKAATKFWNIWAEYKDAFLKHKSDQAKYYAGRIEQLKKLIDFERALNTNRNDLRHKKEIFKINRRRFLTQIFSLRSEGYITVDNTQPFYKFSDALKAFKLIQKDGWLNSQGEYDYSDQEIAFVNQLLTVYVELVYVEKMVEYFVLGEFEIKEIAYTWWLEKKVSLFKISNEQPKINNFYLLSSLKQSFKESYYQLLAQEELAFSKEYDKKIEAHELLLKETVKGLNPNEFMPLYMYIELEKEGLKAYKDSIAGIYFPQEEIDVNKAYIVFDKYDILILHLIYALGALHSYSTQFIIADEHKNSGVFLSKENVLQIFSHYEEWRDLQLNQWQQMCVLDFITSINNKLPYSPLVETNKNEFLLVPVAFIEDKGYSRVFYDYLITDYLYMSKNVEEELYEHQVREKAISEQIIKKINDVLPSANGIAQFKWPEKKELWGRKGEVDGVVYFPEENILYLIEMKLCNTLSKSLDRKLEWLDKSIYNGEKSAAYQLKKDIDFFRNQHTYSLIANALNLNEKLEFKPVIIPLILTDIFWIDHKEVVYDCLDEKKALCISIFELNRLLEGRLNILSDEKSTIPVSGQGKWLYKQISKNVFWNGIENRKLRDFATIGSVDDVGKIGLSVD